MLYYLVGSRELDGGLMCTASHNPKAYTGAKLVREGAIALSGDEGIQDIRRAIEAGSTPLGARAASGRRAARDLQEVDVYEEFQAAALAMIDPEAIRPSEGGRGRRQRHGRADGRTAAGASRARLDRDLLDARRQLSRPRAQPAATGEQDVHHREGARDRRRSGDRVGRGRRPLLLHRRHRGVRGRRFPDGAAGRVAARQEPRPGPSRGDPVRRARQLGGARHGQARRRRTAHQPCRPRLLQDADARGGLAVRRRGLGALLLQGLLLRGLGHDPGAADPRAALQAGQAPVGAAEALSRAVLHLR